MARRRPPKADVHTAAADHDTTTMNTGASFEWRECPQHPWYGVSVMVTGAQAVCVPPLDGPNHMVSVAS